MALSSLTAGLIWLLINLGGSPNGQVGGVLDDLLQLRQPTSGRFRVTANVRGMDQNVQLSGVGAFVQPDRAQLKLSAGGEEYEVITVGQTAYYRATGDRGWSEQRLDSTSTTAPTVGLAESLNPAELESALESIISKIQLAGTETLEGAPTRHYHGDFDLLELAERASPEAGSWRGQLDRLTLGLDFWIGTSDHNLYGLRLAVEAIQAAGLAAPGAGKTMTADLDLRLYDLDQPISIEPPVRPPRTAPVQAPAQVPRAGR